MTKQEQVLLIKKENLKKIMVMCIKQSYNEGYRDSESEIEREDKDITYIYECIFKYIDSFLEEKSEID